MKKRIFGVLSLVLVALFIGTVVFAEEEDDDLSPNLKGREIGTPNLLRDATYNPALRGPARPTDFTNGRGGMNRPGDVIRIPVEPIPVEPIPIITLFHPADANRDGQIEINELTGYAAYLAKIIGSEEAAGREDLLDAEKIWKSGEKYESYSYPFNHADANQDGRIELQEITAYAAFLATIVGPEEASEDEYLQDAVWIWKNGEYYKMLDDGTFVIDEESRRKAIEAEVQGQVDDPLFCGQMADEPEKNPLLDK